VVKSAATLFPLPLFGAPTPQIGDDVIIIKLCK